ncbi:hypothetical protein ILUMI_06058 [Ignelater luminosus]|uniref:Cytosolic fatty-acid binding proteins domain-containing protein n=1 Tax=Ignelater luminosus TaxID=2038154 RepID=A0A8K0D611_IGNLU|nr:hypothetical protein ILUMI_06058 [Ignelater luminosus]
MGLEEYFGKKYQLVSSENFDEYMKALDVHGVLRKIASKLHPVLVLNRNGDEYTLTSTLPFKTIDITFKPGVEFDQETPDGRDVKSVITIDGCTLHEVQTDDSGKETILDRIFSNDEVKVVLKIDNVTATRIYRLQQDAYY